MLVDSTLTTELEFCTCSWVAGLLVPIPIFPLDVMRSLSSAVSQPPEVLLVKNLIPPSTPVAAERFKLLSLLPSFLL